MAEARTGTDVRPELVDPKFYGHHTSKVERGIRVWNFIDEKGRTRFLRAVGGGAFRKNATIKKED